MLSSSKQLLKGPLQFLDHTWHLEGEGRAWVESGKLCLQEASVSEGVLLWLAQELPTKFRMQFSVSFGNNQGIGVFFVAAKGVDGKDVLDSLLERTGRYSEYTQGRISCYGLSLHRFFPDGKHNSGSNIRKNPGFHLVNHVEPDPMMEAGKVYRTRIEKDGNWLRLWVDENLVHDWTDLAENGVARRWKGGVSFTWASFLYDVLTEF